jgi:hypothetical protein
MARISVYIRDDLLEQARSLSGGEKTSQLVQRGLERLVEDATRTPSYARPPLRVGDRIIEIRDRLLAEATKDYEQGYAAAVEAAGAMPLNVINALVDANFDLKVWLDPFKAGLRHELVQTALPGTDQDDVIRRLRKDATAAMAKSKSPTSPSSPSSPWHLRGKSWWLWKTAEALGDLADPIGYDQYSFTPTKARQRGYADAMRELWSALENPGSSSSDVLHQIGEMEEEYHRKKAAGEGGDAPGSENMDDS